MAIYFPIKQPMKVFTWSQRDSQASRTTPLLIHLRDDYMFQFYDTAADNADDTREKHRVVVMNSLFEPVAEITGADMDKQAIGDYYVYTGQFRGEDHAEVGERLYLGFVDANSNFYSQNYMANGNFDSGSTLWTLDAGISISLGQMTYNGATVAATATYDLLLKTGADYTMTVIVASTSGTARGQAQCNGVNIGPEPLTTGTHTFTFTATGPEFTIDFSSGGTGSVVINSFTLSMAYADVTPQFITAPYCVKDIEEYTLINGCAVNDYFNMYFADTSFVPRIRAYTAWQDVPPSEEIETAILSNGTINNYYAQSLSQKELQIDYLPAYIVNFMTIVFLLDSSLVDNVAYSMPEQVETVQSDVAPHIIGYRVRLAEKAFAVGYKRVVNDPSDASCTIPTGAYQNRYTGENYQQQGTDENYYPQN